MGRWRRKYQQANTTLTINQCQGEKVYFGFTKDCDKCKGRFTCYTTKAKPFGVEVLNRVLVFAETEKDAEDFASRGHGRVIPEYREAQSVFPYKVELEDGEICIGRVSEEK